METIKLIINLYFQPRKFIINNDTKKFYIGDVLMLLFGMTFLLSLLLLKITTKWGVKQFIASIIVSLINVYLLSAVNAFLIFMYDRLISRKSMSYRDCFKVILPISISAVFVIFIQIVLTITQLREIFLVKLLYAKIIYLYGILDALYYLKILYKYRNVHLVFVMMFFGAIYLLL